MGETTKIEWCDRTASPWHGCSKVHTGCDHCYAEVMSVRNPATLGVWGDEGVRVKSASFIKNLRKWNREGEELGRQLSVFPSICDPFEGRPELVPWREEMFAVADECPWIRLLLLTKRPELVRDLWPVVHAMRSPFPGAPGKLGEPLPCIIKWAKRQNIWLGTSVSDQPTANEYWYRLASSKPLCQFTFLSVEPLIGPIDCNEMWRNGPLPDWVIVGGESGPKARPCHVEWVQLIVDQCRAAGVPCFVKQLGSNPRGHCKDGERAGKYIFDKKGGEPSEWPAELRCREFPELQTA